MINIRLSQIPPKINRMYSSAGRFHKKKEASDLIEALQWEVKSQYKKEMLKGKIGMSVRYSFPRKGTDIDSPVKATLDLLAGFIYENDKQVCVLEIEKFERQAGEGVDITVYEL